MPQHVAPRRNETAASHFVHALSSIARPHVLLWATYPPMQRSTRDRPTVLLPLASAARLVNGAPLHAPLVASALTPPPSRRHLVAASCVHHQQTVCLRAPASHALV